MFDGRRKVVTPPASLQRRMWSPGMSLKTRWRSTGCQTGPLGEGEPGAEPLHGGVVPDHLTKSRVAHLDVHATDSAATLSSTPRSTAGSWAPVTA